MLSLLGGKHDPSVFAAIQTQQVQTQLNLLKWRQKTDRQTDHLSPKSVVSFD